MNRQERRKAGIKKTEPIINIKVSEIDRIKEEAVAKGCERALFLLLAIPVMIIHDKFGELMKKDGREARFADLVAELYDTYEKGYVSLDDLATCLEQEAGIKMLDRRR